MEYFYSFVPVDECSFFNSKERKKLKLIHDEISCASVYFQNFLSCLYYEKKIVECKKSLEIIKNDKETMELLNENILLNDNLKDKLKKNLELFILTQEYSDKFNFNESNCKNEKLDDYEIKIFINNDICVKINKQNFDSYKIMYLLNIIKKYYVLIDKFTLIYIFVKNFVLYNQVFNLYYYNFKNILFFSDFDESYKNYLYNNFLRIIPKYYIDDKLSTEIYDKKIFFNFILYRNHFSAVKYLIKTKKYDKIDKIIQFINYENIFNYIFQNDDAIIYKNLDIFEYLFKNGILKLETKIYYNNFDSVTNKIHKCKLIYLYLICGIIPENFIIEKELFNKCYQNYFYLLYNLKNFKIFQRKGDNEESIIIDSENIHNQQFPIFNTLHLIFLIKNGVKTNNIKLLLYEEYNFDLCYLLPKYENELKIIFSDENFIRKLSHKYYNKKCKRDMNNLFFDLYEKKIINLNTIEFYRSNCKKLDD